jgi:hypothetical protein
MASPYTRDKIENWTSDFCMSDALRPFPAPLRDLAPELLVTFLVAACETGDLDPADIEEADLKTALATLATLQIPEDLRPEVPALCAALLTHLETEGRLSKGRLLGTYVKALTPAYLEAASGKPKPITRPGAKIGRNEPCPCGSGKKYKKCCG